MMQPSTDLSHIHVIFPLLLVILVKPQLHSWQQPNPHDPDNIILIGKPCTSSSLPAMCSPSCCCLFLHSCPFSLSSFPPGGQRNGPASILSPSPLLLSSSPCVRRGDNSKKFTSPPLSPRRCTHSVAVKKSLTRLLTLLLAPPIFRPPPPPMQLHS